MSSLNRHSPHLLHDPEVRLAELPEALVQDLWHHTNYGRANLRTTAGAQIHVESTGLPNTNGGPDFLGAHVRLDDTLWVGDVEIHRTSVEWFRHGHHRDDRYNSVILHVTLLSDLWTGTVVRQDGTVVPELVLSGYLNNRLRTLLYRFRNDVRPDPLCRAELPSAPTSLRRETVRGMARARLKRQRDACLSTLKHASDIDELLYRYVFAALGHAKNAQPMRLLAERIPLAAARALHDPQHLEAVFLGTAGLIPDSRKLTGSEESKAYVARLRSAYGTGEPILDATPMSPVQWQYFRLRPANFPPLRIAQGCALIHNGLLQRPCWLQNTLECASSPTEFLAACRRALQPGLHSFWTTHYRLERESPNHTGSIGGSKADHIIINAILPLAAAVAEQDWPISGRLDDLLALLPPEDDEVTRKFDDIGMAARTAADSQGVHELYGSLCTKHGCLRCPIGRHILRRPPITDE